MDIVAGRVTMALMSLRRIMAASKEKAAAGLRSMTGHSSSALVGMPR
jgi:hypothetical protein